MGATFLRKFATAVSGVNIISIPLIQFSGTSFALSGNWTPVNGDVVISKDNDTFTNITTLPSAKAAGNSNVWDFYLSVSECTAKQTRVMISDAATKAIEDDYFIVEFYGNSGAMHTIDYSTVSQDSNGYFYSDVAAWSGSVLTSPATAGIPDINVKNIGGSTSQGVAGYMAPDWSHINAPTSTVNLANTSIGNILGDVYGNISGSVNTLTNLPAITPNWLTATGLASDAAAEIADTVFKRSVSGVQDTAEEHSLCTIVLQSTESSIAGTTLTVNKVDGTTPYLTKTLTKTANDSPIRGIT